MTIDGNGDKDTALAAIRGIHAGQENTPLPIRTLVTALGEHAYAAGIFFFAAICLIPAPPGLSLLIGLPLVILSFLNLMGKPFWLPAFIMSIEIPSGIIGRFKKKVLPRLQAAERILHPNAPWLQNTYAQRFVNSYIGLLSISVLVPLPFTAMLPSFCICLLSLGMMQKDYRWVLAGVLLGAFALLIVSIVLHATIRLVNLTLLL
jgi:hypothetical protein